MKVLIVCSGNASNLSFIDDQVEALREFGIVFDYFYVFGKGFKGYLNSLKQLKVKLKEFQPDLIHAHYGLSGLLANLQRKIQVITTYHGSDIHQKKNLKFSKLTILLSKQNIFVSEILKNKAQTSKGVVIPCGINFSIFNQKNKGDCRKIFNLSNDKKYILFSSSFDNTIKNYPFAKEVVESLGSEFILLELKGYNRNEVAQLFNAVDLALLTSFEEGSPQFIKEAVACGCPVVSINVGDVKKQLYDVPNTMVIDDYNLNQFKKAIISGVNNNSKPTFKDSSQWDNSILAKKIYSEYQKILRSD